MLTDIAWQYYIMRQLKNIHKTSIKKLENIQPKEDNKPNSRSFFLSNFIHRNIHRIRSARPTVLQIQNSKNKNKSVNWDTEETTYLLGILICRPCQRCPETWSWNCRDKPTTYTCNHCTIEKKLQNNSEHKRLLYLDTKCIYALYTMTACDVCQWQVLVFLEPRYSKWSLSCSGGWVHTTALTADACTTAHQTCWRQAIWKPPLRIA